MEITVEDLLSLDIDNLAEAQYNALKEDTCERLSRIIDLIRKDKIEEIRELIEFSPAGDAWGMDNYYIKFVNELDIGDIIDSLIRLREIIEEE